jgi:hypothetical protein
VNGADSVPKIGSVITSRAANGAMMNSKDDRVALVWREHLDAGLLARPLLGENEFAALEILPSPAQEESDLKRKDHLAV